MSDIPKSVPAKYMERIRHWDDEREIGNSLIVSLNNGWYWAGIDPFPGNHVAGFDTVRDVVNALRSTAPCNCDECKRSLANRVKIWKPWARLTKFT